MDGLNPRLRALFEKVQSVLVKHADIWSASELVLEGIFIAAFIAKRTHTAPVRAPAYLPGHSHSADGEA